METKNKDPAWFQKKTRKDRECFLLLSLLLLFVCLLYYSLCCRTGFFVIVIWWPAPLIQDDSQIKAGIIAFQSQIFMGKKVVPARTRCQPLNQICPGGSEMAAPTLTCASARREGLLLPSELLGDMNKDCVFIMI